MNNNGFNSEVDKYIETLEKCEYIKEKEVKLLCDKAKEQLSKEENVIYLDAPITVSTLTSIKILKNVFFNSTIFFLLIFVHLPYTSIMNTIKIITINCCNEYNKILTPF